MQLHTRRTTLNYVRYTSLEKRFGVSVFVCHCCCCAPVAPGLHVVILVPCIGRVVLPSASNVTPAYLSSV